MKFPAIVGPAVSDWVGVYFPFCVSSAHPTVPVSVSAHCEQDPTVRIPPSYQPGSDWSTSQGIAVHTGSVLALACALPESSNLTVSQQEYVHV